MNGDMFVILLAFIGLCVCIFKEAMSDLKRLLLEVIVLLNRMLRIKTEPRNEHQERLRSNEAK